MSDCAFASEPTTIGVSPAQSDSVHGSAPSMYAPDVCADAAAGSISGAMISTATAAVSSFRGMAVPSKRDSGCVCCNHRANRKEGTMNPAPFRFGWHGPRRPRLLAAGAVWRARERDADGRSCPRVCVHTPVGDAVTAAHRRCAARGGVGDPRRGDRVRAALCVGRTLARVGQISKLLRLLCLLSRR